MYDSARRRTHVVDGSDGASSNWMRFVNCARNWGEQNMLAFQYQGELYYRTIKIIPRCTELMVFYGSEFAKKLDINLGKYNAPKSYAQKFGAHVPKKSKMSPDNKQTHDGSAPDAKEKEKDVLQPATCKTLTPAIPEKKNNKKRPKENQSENKNESPEVKKRKTKSKNKKLEPKQTNIEPASKYSKISREKVKERGIKLSEDAIKELNSKHIDISPEIETAKANGEEDLENKLIKKILPEENITNHNIDFTKRVGNIAISDDKNIETGHVLIHNNQQKNRKTQSTNQIMIQDAYFTCNECNYRGITKEHLERHLRFHDVNRKFACEMCGYRFNTNNCLNEHKLSHKTDKSSVKIYNICDYTTARSGYLKSHLDIHHQEKHACNVCGRKFTRASHLKTHTRIHTGEKPYTCEICDHKFSRLGDLRKHKRIHTGEKPYTCEICNHKFSGLGDLRKHKRIHTGEKPHTCEICNHKFSQLGNLQMHKRIHTGEKPYTCEICNHKFSQLGSLQMHKRIHTGEKPYTCEICNHKFSLLSNLKTHKRVHTGEKPYTCDICDYKCSLLNSLKIHLKKKHLS